jgi:hypothetical protein
MSAIRLGAMQDALDVNGVPLLNKTYSIIADTEAQLISRSLKFFHIADTGFRKAAKTGENAHSGRNIEAAHIRAGLVR